MKTAKRGSAFRRKSAFRLASMGLLAVLVLALNGDRGVYTAGPGGIDPLEVLNLSVRPNVLIVVDSSGSMREMPDANYAADGFPDTPVEGEVVGDDPSSKLAQAKAALRTVVQANQDKVSFQFGRYVQSTTLADYGPDTQNRFLYTKICATSNNTCNNEANAIVVDCGGNAACGIGLYRVAGSKRVVGANTIYHLFTNRYYNGQHLRVRTNGTNGSTASTDAPGTGQVGTPTAPFVFVQNLNNSNNPTGADVRFTFQGIRWHKANQGQNNADTSCGGFESLVGLAACTNNLQLGTIDPHLGPEVVIDSTTGNITGYTNTTVGTTINAAQRPPIRGVRASGFTPIAETLIDFKGIFNGMWNAPGNIKDQDPKPRTSVIFLTDGDDTCTGPTTSDNSASGADNRALRAAHKAQQLFERIAAAEPASSVTTFVVVFGTGASADRGNWIAWGGSGLNQAGTCGGAGQQACIGITGTGGAARWSSVPTQAQRDACPTCRDAFLANDLNKLTAALQQAIEQGVTEGEFSDQQSITESIFEYASLGGKDPLDPHERYNTTLPVLLQSTFDMPDFTGHLKAFRNDAETSRQEWDAGQKILDLDRNGAIDTFTNVTYAALHASATPDTIATSAALVKRRIYTTTRNGVFVSGTPAAVVGNLTTARYQPSEQIALWPPDSSLDSGGLDDELGINLTYTELQDQFGACTSPPSPAVQPPTSCVNNTPGLAVAKREARQMILAYSAGAEVIKTNGKPVRNTARELQFRARRSALAESTLAAPAVVAPPLEGLPETHISEYRLFRDGPRTTSDVAANGIAHGFGLRNPDLDADAPDTGADPRTALKPVMSVVYHGANDMLHAFRAGPCPGGVCAGSTVETGGEELWAFVPYDQLGKLKERMQPQARDPHTYVIAAPVRVSDIFVPGPFSFSVGSATAAGDGVWRTVLLFGRGIGGKHLTALDVTAPGPFTASSLSTAPPIALWNRGNPDTEDGTPGGSKNNNAPLNTDYDRYLTMGQTWSVPAIGFVTAANNTTPRKNAGVEFVAYIGSGYGSGTNAASEGTHLYTIDPLTGDMVAAVNVGDRSGMSYENALVASPSAFNEKALDIRNHLADSVNARFVANGAASKVSRVYVGDIHGRMWRILSDTPSAAPLLFADFGATQPIGNPAALAFYDSDGSTFRPHVYVESGNDNRITPPPQNTPPFNLFGLRDDDLTADPNAGDGIGGVATVLFRIPLPNGFRGTVQPATAFTDTNPPLVRVFFAGTRFNLPGSANAPVPPPCRSSFDSILAAVGGATGAAAYDLSAGGDDRFVNVTGQRIQAVRVAGGRLVVDVGLGADNPPPPPSPPEATEPTESGESDVTVGAFDPATGLPSIPGLVPFKFGSSVCR